MKKNPNPVAVAVAQIPFISNSDSHFFISPNHLGLPSVIYQSSEAKKKAWKDAVTSLLCIFWLFPVADGVE
nr:hypothetical protein CFP56_17846 [Quercus suber]